MEAAAEKAVERVINVMYENPGEQLTIDDMARTAMFSKFHFTRLFQRATGISPARFLSAVRLQKAKQLLTSTTLTVTEISHRVGYTSVGTFSFRFRACVGTSPTMYRQLSGDVGRLDEDTGQVGGQARQLGGHFGVGRPRNPVGPRFAVLTGHVRSPTPDRFGPVALGLFPDRLPQGQPAGCLVLPRPGPFRMENVPQGRWFLLGQATVDGERFVVDHGPIVIRPDTGEHTMELRLRPRSIFDPPVLLAHLDPRRVVA